MILHIMIGVPGSGKSYYISTHKSEKDIVISPDNLRRQMTGSVSDQSMNKEVWQRAYELLRLYSQKENDIWFDATNVRLSSINKILAEAGKVDIEFIVLKDSENATLCKQRIKADLENKKDRSNVPDEVVDRMSEEFKQLKFYDLPGRVIYK